MTGTGISRTVIGVDLHESSREAAAWTIRHLAPEARHALVHAVDLPDPPAPLRALVGGRDEERQAAADDARRRLEELRDAAGGGAVEVHVRQGKPAATILGLAGETGADLIVVGEQGPTRGVAALLGSTAERVLVDAEIPVLVARKTPDAPPRRLLVAIDPSAIAEHVLAWARALAAGSGETTVLNVVDRRLLTADLSDLPSAEGFRDLEAEATRTMHAWLEERVAKAGLPASRTRVQVVLGDPAYEIIASAARQGIDLIVIGSKGGDVARTPLIGRIVNKVVRSAPCSVLVV